jgi:hypothetical protein
MKALFTLLLTLCILGSAFAYDPLAKEELNDYIPPEEWQEGSVEIPDAFDPEDLQPFTVNGSQDRFEYAIERGSLQAGRDGVVRFLLVIRSTRGAVNSSYEGLRCGHRQSKVYAYGSGSGLSPLPAPQWQEIPKTSSGYQAILYEDMLCSLSTGLPNPPDAVFQAMRSDRKVNTPFLPGGSD